MFFCFFVFFQNSRVSLKNFGIGFCFSCGSLLEAAEMDGRKRQRREGEKEERGLTTPPTTPALSPPTFDSTTFVRPFISSSLPIAIIRMPLSIDAEEILAIAYKIYKIKALTGSQEVAAAAFVLSIGGDRCGRLDCRRRDDCSGGLGGRLCLAGDRRSGVAARGERRGAHLLHLIAERGRERELADKGGRERGECFFSEKQESAFLSTGSSPPPPPPVVPLPAPSRRGEQSRMIHFTSKRPPFFKASGTAAARPLRPRRRQRRLHVLLLLLLPQQQLQQSRRAIGRSRPAAAASAASRRRAPSAFAAGPVAVAAVLLLFLLRLLRKRFAPPLPPSLLQKAEQRHHSYHQQRPPQSTPAPQPRQEKIHPPSKPLPKERSHSLKRSRAVSSTSKAKGRLCRERLLPRTLAPADGARRRFPGG